MRKLATIRTISNISSIEGADRIECIEIDGWKLVAQKGLYALGQEVVYIETDAVLPISEQFEYLRPSSYVKKDWLIGESNPTGEGFRVKTIRLRGQISQGIITSVPEIVVNSLFDGDLSDHFGIVKWDPPVPATLAGRVKGNFPSFIPKTDAERVQNLTTKDKEPYLDDDFEVTVKLDGSSMTMYHRDGVTGVCSRNLELDWENDAETTFARIFLTGKYTEILPKFGNYALQGELMGPGIQGNRENFKKHQFHLFNVYDIDRATYLNAMDRQLFFGAILSNQRQLEAEEIQQCPYNGIEKAAAMSVDELLTLAEGKSINNPVREGLVFKSIQHPHFSFKVISNNFLLKED